MFVEVVQVHVGLLDHQVEHVVEPLVVVRVLVEDDDRALHGVEVRRDRFFLVSCRYLVVRDDDLEEGLDELAEEHVEAAHGVLDELAEVLDQPVVVLGQRRVRSA